MKKQWEKFLTDNEALWSYNMVPSLVAELDEAEKKEEAEKIKNKLNAQGVELDADGNLKLKKLKEGNKMYQCQSKKRDEKREWLGVISKKEIIKAAKELTSQGRSCPDEWRLEVGIDFVPEKKGSKNYKVDITYSDLLGSNSWADWGNYDCARFATIDNATTQVEMIGVLLDIDCEGQLKEVTAKMSNEYDVIYSKWISTTERIDEDEYIDITDDDIILKRKNKEEK